MPVSDTLPVHLSREELHEIETVESFEATGAFTVEILNHGRDAHPHLKLSDSLAAVATIEEANPYVPNDESIRIRVDARRPPEPVTGILKIETGYGADAAGVQVTIRQPTEEERRAEQSPDATQSESADAPSAERMDPPNVGLSSENLPVLALAFLALLIAAVTAAVIDDIVVIAGVVVVLVAVVFAGVLLLR